MARIVLSEHYKKVRGRMDDVVIYSFYGKTYMRRYVVPDDRKTEKQLHCRDMFRKAVATWKNMPQHEKDCWKEWGTARNVKGYNVFISLYMMGKGKISAPVAFGERYKAATPSVLDKEAFAFPSLCLLSSFVPTSLAHRTGDVEGYLRL